MDPWCSVYQSMKDHRHLSNILTWKLPKTKLLKLPQNSLIPLIFTIHFNGLWGDINARKIHVHPAQFCHGLTSTSGKLLPAVATFPLGRSVWGRSSSSVETSMKYREIKSKVEIHRRATHWIWNLSHLQVELPKLQLLLLKMSWIYL